MKSKEKSKKGSWISIDIEIDAMSYDDVCQKLKHLGEYCDNLDEQEAKELFKK